MPLRLFNNYVNPNHLYQPGNIAIYFQNINGWTRDEENRKINDLKLFIRRQKADVICLAHTNLNEESNPIFFYPYNVYMHNTERLFSGVAILVKRDIEHSLINKKFDGLI